MLVSQKSLGGNGTPGLQGQVWRGCSGTGYQHQSTGYGSAQSQPLRHQGPQLGLPLPPLTPVTGPTGPSLPSLEPPSLPSPSELCLPIPLSEILSPQLFQAHPLQGNFGGNRYVRYLGGNGYVPGQNSSSCAL